MGKTARSKGVSKAKWLSHALDVLAAEGVQGVRIERLARDLGIAKAGFYWHFRDRNDLLQGILDYWALEFTAVVTKDTNLHEVAAERRLYGAMIRILEDDLAKYDLAIRDWAMRDDNAAETLQIVTQSRLDFAREVFSELGFRGRQLEMRTRLFVCYHSWETAMFGDLSMDERRKMLRLRHKLLLSK